MRQQADRDGLASIAVPRIGTGYGGLWWRKVRAIIEKVFADWPGALYVYEEYAPESDTEDSPGAGERKARGKP
jgi:O-acetyl-ADP-ribose deacetylase (regulator of RNase III)